MLRRYELVVVDSETGQAYGRDDILPDGTQASLVYRCLENPQIDAVVLNDEYGPMTEEEIEGI